MPSCFSSVVTKQGSARDRRQIRLPLDLQRYFVAIYLELRDTWISFDWGLEIIFDESGVEENT